MLDRGFSLPQTLPRAGECTAGSYVGFLSPQPLHSPSSLPSHSGGFPAAASFLHVLP